jgi:hypothetical protein
MSQDIGMETRMYVLARSLSHERAISEHIAFLLDTDTTSSPLLGVVFLTTP